MTGATVTRASAVDFIVELFERRGAESYLGELVSMAEHMLQAAACAEHDGADRALVAAALLHDVGHYTGEFPEDALENGINNWHDELGAKFLSHWYPPAVTEPIRLHVAAKRYLCAVEPAYFGDLSPASVNSLKVQGGPFSTAAVREFERSPHHCTAVQLRRYDDSGKTAGVITRSIQDYRPLLESLLRPA